MKKTFFTAATLLSVATAHARLGQPQFNLEKEMRKKFSEGKITEGKTKSFNRTMSFNNLSYSVDLRGEITLPMNTKGDYICSRSNLSNASNLRIHNLPFEYYKYKSAKEILTFSEPVPKAKAMKFLKKLLPKSTKRTTKISNSEYTAKDFSKKIYIKFDTITQKDDQGETITLVKSITAEYDKKQLDKKEAKERKKLYEKVLASTKKGYRNNRSHRSTRTRKTIF